MEFTIASMGYAITRGHTCRDAVVASTLVDVEAEMKAQSDLLAIENLAWPAHQVWQELRRRFYDDNNPHVARGLSERQVVERVHRIRNQHFSGNVHVSIEIPPLFLALGEAVQFFQFHYITINQDDFDKPTRLIGWAHPALVALLRYHGTTAFVDGTFRCVPRGFAQCVVFMVHDRASGVFVPVFYILSTSRTADAYWDMIHFVVQATDQNLEPAEVIRDFEAGLINSIQTQFPNAIVLGCLFHMKQALRRGIERYAIPDEECSIAITPGVLDMLTVMDPARINKGINWVKREMKMRCPEAGLIYPAEKWSEFWGYFARTWLDQYPIEVWNVYGLENELIARTNSPLERFNIELNAKFPTAHPSMATFITVIKTLSAEYVRRIADIPRGRARRVSRDRIQLPQPVAIDSDIDSEVEEHAADTSADASVTSIAL